MDRNRPLWEVYVIDGLHSGRWALLTKYHHATIDGAAGQLMLSILTDPDRDAPPPGTDSVSSAANKAGGAVKAIVMAICAGGLREYLLAHDALPDRPLRAMVPVSIRTVEEEDPWTNRVAGLIAELPTDSDDPLERVARCHASMADAKRKLDMVPAAELVDLAQFSAPQPAHPRRGRVSLKRPDDDIC